MKRLGLLVPLTILLLAALACGGKTFDQTHVYSLYDLPLDQLYDPAADHILSDDVWVFRSDGTYNAVLMMEGEQIFLSGTYGSDETGNGYFIFLETGAGDYDTEIKLAPDDSYIEWEDNGEVYIFTLAH